MVIAHTLENMIVGTPALCSLALCTHQSFLLEPGCEASYCLLYHLHGELQKLLWVDIVSFSPDILAGITIDQPQVNPIPLTVMTYRSPYGMSNTEPATKY
jgi:hypothetical protein